MGKLLGADGIFDSAQLFLAGKQVKMIYGLLRRPTSGT